MENKLSNIRFENPEQEIAYLRQELLKKEKELNYNKVSFDKDELVKDKIKTYEQNLREDVLSQTFGLKNDEIEAISLNLSPEEHDDKIKGLLSILNEKGVKNALDVLRKMNDPHLEDDFHRFLVQYLSHGHSAKGVNLQSDEF